MEARRCVLQLAVVFAASGASVEAPTSQVQAEQSCQAAMTQFEIKKCSTDTASQAAAGLAAAIAAYRERLKGEQLRLFDASQAAWEQFRAAACKFQASGVEGGSAYSMVLSACLETLANERRRAITELDACEEGDLSCPNHR
jgi:uncharacterized protein YecT (DUF1311 family)